MTLLTPSGTASARVPTTCSAPTPWPPRSSLPPPPSSSPSSTSPPDHPVRAAQGRNTGTCRSCAGGSRTRATSSGICVVSGRFGGAGPAVRCGPWPTPLPMPGPRPPTRPGSPGSTPSSTRSPARRHPAGGQGLHRRGGVITTSGSPVVAGEAEPAFADAACLAGARAAGARIVGKTNLHELCFGASGINPHYGTPVNPIDPRRVPGRLVERVGGGGGHRRGRRGLRHRHHRLDPQPGGVLRRRRPQDHVGRGARGGRPARWRRRSTRSACWPARWPTWPSAPRCSIRA